MTYNKELVRRNPIPCFEKKDMFRRVENSTQEVNQVKK